MPYAVTLRLDPVAGARVTAMWTSIAAGGASDLLHLGYAPHLTLAVLCEGDAPLQERVRQATAGWRRLNVRFAGFGVFPGPQAVLWLAPVPTAALLSWQRALCDALPADRLDPHYRPGNWMPHVTLGEDLTPAALATAYDRTASDWEPFTATLEQVDLVRFRPVSLLWHARLPGSP
jgi:2'-5' RNA ligase